MKVSVIIPTFKRQAFLKSLIKAVLSESIYVKEILVVNTSNSKLAFTNNKIKVINCPNLLLGKNIAVQKSKSDWILILDDDLVFGKNTISKFIKFSLKYKFDGASGLLIQDLHYNNIFLRLCKYGLQTFFKTASLNLLRTDSKPYKSTFLPGGFLFVKKHALLHVGLFDTKYLLPFYNEDTDITVRLDKLGFKLMVFPKIRAVHLKAKSGGVRQSQRPVDWYYAFGFNNSYFYIKNYSVFIYFLYSIFNLRDHLFVAKKLDLELYFSYIKGIYYGYRTSGKFFNS